MRTLERPDVAESGSSDDRLNIVVQGEEAAALLAMMKRSEETHNPQKAARHERAAFISQYLVEKGHLPA